MLNDLIFIKSFVVVFLYIFENHDETNLLKYPSKLASVTAKLLIAISNKDTTL